MDGSEQLKCFLFFMNAIKIRLLQIPTIYNRCNHIHTVPAFKVVYIFANILMMQKNSI